MRNTILTLIILLLSSMLPAQEIDVYLIGGQSNATGQGYLRNIPKSFITDTNVQIYYSKFMNGGGKKEHWQPLCQASESKDRFGVELSMGTCLQQLYPKQRIAIIKHASSGTNLYKHWNPGNRHNEEQGTEFKIWIETVKTGIEALRAKGYIPVIRAMVWQQGEADASFDAGLTNSKNYGKNLKNLIMYVREILNAPNMLFVYGEVMPLETERLTQRHLIRQAQIDVSEIAKTPLSVKNAILVEADDLQMRRSDYHTPRPNDEVHLGTYGILTLGERFAKAIHNLYH